MGKKNVISNPEQLTYKKYECKVEREIIPKKKKQVFKRKANLITKILPHKFTMPAALPLVFTVKPIQPSQKILAPSFLFKDNSLFNLTYGVLSGYGHGIVTAQAINNCGVITIRSTTVKLPACPAPPPPPFAKGFVQPTASETMAVNVFPNPTVCDFKLQVITAGKEEIRVSVHDIAGRFIKRLTVLPYQTISIGNDLKAGAYMMEVKQSSSVKTMKLIKY